MPPSGGHRAKPRSKNVVCLLLGEVLVYKWLDRLSQDYRGELWHFYTLSNGSFYMAPEQPARFHLQVATNGFDSSMSADAAGIVATLFALGQLLETHGNDALVDRYHLLHDYAFQHPEARLILRAID